MRRLVLAAAVVVVLSAATPAHAGTALLMPDGPAKTLYESWIAQSYVPTASVAVEVHLHDCLRYDVEACTDVHRAPMIVVFPDLSYLFGPGYSSDEQLGARLNFMHELGHVLDFSRKTHAYRNTFERIMHITPAIHLVDMFGTLGVETQQARPTRRQRQTIATRREAAGWLGGLAAWPGGSVIQPDEQFAMAYAYCSVFPYALPWHILHRVYWGYDFHPSVSEYGQLCALMRSL